MYKSLSLLALSVAAAALPLTNLLEGTHAERSCNIAADYGIYVYDTTGPNGGNSYGAVSDELVDGGYTINGLAELELDCLNVGGPQNLNAWMGMTSGDWGTIGAAAPSIPNSGSANIGKGNANYLVVTAVGATPVGAKPYPSAVGNDLAPAGFPVAGVESAIWTATPRSGSSSPMYQLGVQWVNSDGTTVPGVFVWWEAANKLIITGDYAAFSDAWDYAGALYEATFWLV